MRKTQKYFLLATLFAVVAMIPGGLLMAQPVHYEVFLLAGQSNMDGRGQVKDLIGPLAPYANPQPNVMINYSGGGLKRPVTLSDGLQPLRPGFSCWPGKPNTLPSGTFGPEVSFGAAISQALPEKKILLIKCAEGGTTLLRDWNPNQREKLYDRFIQFVRSTQQMIAANGDSCEIRGMLWHQGEGDIGKPSGVYGAVLTEFINHVRADLGAPKLPFLIGQICYYERATRANIFADQWSVAKSIPFTAVVESKGLVTFDKGTHFDAASQIELGNRFAKEMLNNLR